jgi:hypothetical protein
MKFSCLNFFKFAFAVKILQSKDPDIVTIRRTLDCRVPTLALHGINSVSAGNYKLMDTESTGGMVFSARNLPAHGRGIHLKMVYSAGNYQLTAPGIHPKKRIPPEITCSFALIQTSKIKMRRKSSD